MILGKLPMYGLGATVVPLLVAGLMRRFPPEGTALEIQKHIYIVDAILIGLVMTAWTAVLTVAIGCCVVMVMKGPHYVADSYPINDAPRPDPEDD